MTYKLAQYSDELRGEQQGKTARPHGQVAAHAWCEVILAPLAAQAGQIDSWLMEIGRSIGIE